MKAQNIAVVEKTFEIAFNINLKGLRNKQAQSRYAATFMRLLNDYKNGKITLQEFAEKAKERYNLLNQELLSITDEA